MDQKNNECPLEVGLSCGKMKENGFLVWTNKARLNKINIGLYIALFIGFSLLFLILYFTENLAFSMTAHFFNNYAVTVSNLQRNYLYMTIFLPFLIWAILIQYRRRKEWDREFYFLKKGS